MTALFKRAYPDRNPADAMFLDTGLRRGCLNFCRQRARAGGATWNWLFNLEAPFNGGTVPYVFRNAAYMEAQYIPAVSERVEDEMSGAWTAFAGTGDPNTGEIPAWPRVTADSVPTMCFDRHTDLRVDHDRELMERYPDPPRGGFPGSGKMYAIFGVEPEQ